MKKKKLLAVFSVILLFSTTIFIHSKVFYDPILQERIRTADSVGGNKHEESKITILEYDLNLHNEHKETHVMQSSLARSLHLQGERLIQEEFGRSEKLNKSAVKINEPCMVTPESCLHAGNLIGREKERFTDCLTDATSHINQWRILTGHNLPLTRCLCHLANSTQMYSRVALVSLPGSGNTWVRGLLERTTDICTGAMWCDPNLRATHFCAEGLHDRTLVVKNHDPIIRWRGEIPPKTLDYSENNKPEFDAAIFIHRNPYDAMIAEHNRELGYTRWKATYHLNLSLSSGHHVQSFGPKYFSEFY